MTVMMMMIITMMIYLNLCDDKNFWTTEYKKTAFYEAMKDLVITTSKNLGHVFTRRLHTLFIFFRKNIITF